MRRYKMQSSITNLKGLLAIFININHKLKKSLQMLSSKSVRTTI